MQQVGGKEEDKEWGSQMIQDYGFRIYNPTIGKFLSVDPLTNSYPWYTPYQFAGNKVIGAIDLDGLEEKWVVMYEVNETVGAPSINRNKTEIKINKDTEIYENGQRVAKTHIKIYKADGSVSTEIFIEQLDADGKMSNGFYPTARYNLNDRAGDNYEAGDAWTENTDTWASTAVWNLIFDLEGSSESEKFRKHINTSPEKIVEMEDFDDAMLAINSLMGVNPLISKSPPKVKKSVGCFTKDTKVKTNNGYISIGEIEVGDSIWAYNDTTSVFGFKKVSRVIKLESSGFCKVSYGNVFLEVTSEHPFYTPNGWQKIGELSIGDSLFTFSNTWEVISNIYFVSKPVTVYNLIVDDFHTYFVSENDILVHNGDPCQLKPEASASGTKKHGLKWKEGPARAKDTGNPQGQWGNKSDIGFATEKAKTLEVGKDGYFKLPEGHSSKVHLPNGTTVNAEYIWVRHNKNGKTWHGYPMREADIKANQRHKVVVDEP